MKVITTIVESRLGSIIKYWNNRYIEIDESPFTHFWLYLKSTLSECCQKIFKRVPKVSKSREAVFQNLRFGMFKSILKHGLYCLNNCANIWRPSLLKGSARLIYRQSFRFQEYVTLKISFEPIASKGKLSISSVFYLLNAGGHR